MKDPSETAIIRTVPKIKNKTKCIVAAILLFFAVLATFAEVRHFEFLNFDDNVYITENPHVSSGVNTNNISWAFTHSHAGYWHPLTWISHQIDCQFFGISPEAPHIENVIIHALTAVLLLIFLFRLFGSLSSAWYCALLFAIHPQRIESVAWITERKDVLSLFFFLATLLAYQNYRLQESKKNYLLTLVLFVTGLLAKPSLIVLPILLLLVDFWPLNKFEHFELKNWQNHKKIFLEKIPFFAMSVVFSLIVFYSQNEAGALHSLSAVTLTNRIGTASVGYWTYFEKTFWPNPLAIFFPYIQHNLATTLTAALSLIIFTIVILRMKKKYNFIQFAWLWFLIALFPVIGFVSVGGQAYADRWSYLPHIGFAISLCFFLTQMPPPLITKIRMAAAILLILTTNKTSAELPNWQNSKTVFKHALEVTQNNFLAHTNLAQALSLEGDIKSATKHYEEAIRINPLYSEALNNLGNINAKNGDYHTALDLFERALTRSPNDSKMRYNLALTQYNLGNKAEALKSWSSILDLDQTNSATLRSLNYMMKNDFITLCPNAATSSSDTASKAKICLTEIAATLKSHQKL